MTGALRFDRDRYVAFAFAAADVLLELDAVGHVLAANGAVQTVCGHKAAAILGRDVLELIAELDRPVVRRALTTLKGSGRIDPLAVRVRHDSGRQPHALLGGCGLPSVADRVFLTVTLLPPITAAAVDALPRDVATGLHDKDTLLNAALGEAGEAAQRITLIQLDGLTSAVDQLSAERGRVLMAEIGAALRVRSAGGDAAARLGSDEFGLIPGASGGIDQADAIGRDLAAVTRSAGIVDGLIKTRFGSIDLAKGSLSDRDAAKALAYAVKCFCETRGEAFTLTSLQEGFADEVKTTFSRFDDLRRLIDDGRFVLAFQPIVQLADRRVHHYEALSRFPDGQSPYDVVRFGEGVGLVESLDLAVARMALAELARTADTKVAVNLSGRSIQSERFRGELAKLLDPARALGDRLIFEITESWTIDHIDGAASFVRWLRGEHHLVCLDDFGAGAAAYNYLRHFEVDFVKIDGPFLRAAVRQKREAALVTSICRLCAELGSDVIGEMIEDETQAAAAASMGVRYGQGWLYGRPIPTLAPARARNSVLEGQG
jgi:PAS domain S-box-containing protein